MSIRYQQIYHPDLGIIYTGRANPLPLNMSIKFKSILMRFIKGFLAGGLASMAISLQTGVTVYSFADLKSLGGLLGISFLTGAILALEKMLMWQDTPPTL